MEKNKATGIRGRFKAVEGLDGRAFIFIDGISFKGLNTLKESSKIKIEVMGMPSRVMFVSHIFRFTPSGIYISLPKQMVSVERRQNTRFQTNFDFMVYFELSEWSPKEEDLTSPIIIHKDSILNQWVSVADLSIGGACLHSRFKSVVDYLVRDEQTFGGRIIFPMAEPFEVHILVKWHKRIIDRVVEDDVELARINYKLGIEFAKSSEEAKLKIRQGMRRLSMGLAI